MFHTVWRRNDEPSTPAIQQLLFTCFTQSETLHMRSSLLVQVRARESPVWVGTLARLQPIVLGKSSPYTGYLRPVGWVKV